MPDRHFYLLSHYICYSLFFLFSACWLQRNERNSLWENKGERSEVFSLLRRYLCHGILFTCSPHYICYGLFFLFSACWLQRNERNSLWENKGERSEVYCLLGRYLYHGILFTYSHITFPMVYSFYFLCFGFGRNAINLKVTTLISWKMTIRFLFIAR